MELNIKKNEPNFIEIEFVSGDIGFVDSIKDKLVQKKEVEFISARIGHPQVGNPVLILRTKKDNALDLIIDAVESVEKDVDKFKSALKSAKKK